MGRYASIPIRTVTPDNHKKSSDPAPLLYGDESDDHGHIMHIFGGGCGLGVPTPQSQTPGAHRSAPACRWWHLRGEKRARERQSELGSHLRRSRAGPPFPPPSGLWRGGRPPPDSLTTQPPPQRGNGRERLAPAGRTQADATVTRPAARQRCRGRRARSGVHRGVGADLLDVLRRPLVDDLLPEVGREAFGLNCGSSNGQNTREHVSRAEQWGSTGRAGAA